jgi:cation diffusion facilitator family transporter
MDERSKKTKNAGIYGIIGNVFLLIIKAIVGVVSKSQAMIADSINSAGDIFASLMTFIGNKIASVPKDEDHNLGHGKAEYIFSMFISISMIVVSAKLLYDSVMTLILGSELQFSWFLVLVCIITIITKLILYIYVKQLLKNEENILLEANMEDHRNDCIVTTFTLISVLLTKVNIYWFDSIVGIGISLWICYTGTKIFMESYNILMDISVDEGTKDLIITIANNNDGIKEIRSIISTPIGYKYIIILTIAVSGEMTTIDSHNLADKLESDIAKLDKVDKAIVHVEPV